MEDSRPILTVRFFSTGSGAQPVREWLHGLEPVDRRVIGRELRAVQFGWPIGMPAGSSCWFGPANRESDVYDCSFGGSSGAWLHEEDPQDFCWGPQTGPVAGAAGVPRNRRRSIVARRRRNPHLGSSLESFLEETGDLEEATAIALKRVLAWELAMAMKKLDVSRAELARRMRTSRAVVHRLLNGDDPAVTLATITRAAVALGRRVDLRIAR